jgi:pilus assembly protein Flp/PilA
LDPKAINLSQKRVRGRPRGKPSGKLRRNPQESLKCPSSRSFQLHLGKSDANHDFGDGFLAFYFNLSREPQGGLMGNGRGKRRPQVMEVDFRVPCPTLRRMFQMTKFVSRFMADESGATAIEYGLIAALIAVVIITAVTALGSTIKTKFNAVVTGMGGTAGA